MQLSPKEVLEVSKPVDRYDIHPEDAKEPRLPVTAFQWRDREEGGALHGTMQIGSASFHVMAYPVSFVQGRRGEGKLIVLAGDDDHTKELWAAHGMEGFCETVKIPGIGKNRKYAIFVSPFCT